MVYLLCHPLQDRTGELLPSLCCSQLNCTTEHEGTLKIHSADLPSDVMLTAIYARAYPGTSVMAISTGPSIATTVPTTVSSTVPTVNIWEIAPAVCTVVAVVLMLVFLITVLFRCYRKRLECI